MTSMPTNDDARGRSEEMDEPQAPAEPPAAEEQRQVAEETRRAAEDLRGVGEDMRRLSEQIRRDAEQIRQAHEQIRQAAEDTRRARENVRDAAEQARGAAERLRQEYEAARQAANEQREILEETFKASRAIEHLVQDRPQTERPTDWVERVSRAIVQAGDAVRTAMMGDDDAEPSRLARVPGADRSDIDVEPGPGPEPGPDEPSPSTGLEPTASPRSPRGLCEPRGSVGPERRLMSTGIAGPDRGRTQLRRQDLMSLSTTTEPVPDPTDPADQSFIGG